nr:MAG TPA: hypothetical protein [Caudoviricetes sp.]
MICLLTWLTIVPGRFAASSRYCVGEIFKSFLLVICCVIPSSLTHPRQLPFSVVGIICCVSEWTERCLYSPN